MTRVKEPMCFSRADWRERLGEYERLFERTAAVRGESSTAYTAYPWSQEVPERVHATVPDAKLIYLVRDPIPRVLSHYAQNVWDDLGQRPFDELMDDLEHPLNMPVWSSRYGTQIERWLARFPLERILVLDADDLRHRRRETLQQVFAFLGAETGFESEGFVHEHNTTRSHAAPTALGRRLAARGRDAPSGVVRRLLAREVPAPTLTPDQRARLSALLAPEAARLRELTGLRLEHWEL